jgi:uncharacterized protein
MKSLLDKKTYFFLFLCQWILLSSIAQDIPQKPNPARFVNDYAHFLNTDVAQTLETQLRAYHDTTTNQIVFVSVETLNGLEPYEYALKIHEKWGVGNAKKDNGIVFLVSKKERKIWISVGYGLEDMVPDITTKRIIRDQVTPRFKAGNFDQGIINGVMSIIKSCEGKYNDKYVHQQDASGDEVFLALFVFILIFVVLIAISRKSSSNTVSRRGLNTWGGPTLFGPNIGGGGFFDNHNSGGGGGIDFGGFDFGGGSAGGGGAGGDW